MGEYTYVRSFVSAKSHWDIDYSGEPISLVKEVNAEFNKPCTVRCSGEVCTVIADLTAEEKTTLDGIVAAHKTTAESIDSAPGLDKLSVMHEIMLAAEPTTQFPRLMACLDKNAGFLLALDGQNYTMAKWRAQIAYAAEQLTEDDYNLVLSKIP